MKKIITGILMLALVFSLAACGSEKNNDDDVGIGGDVVQGAEDNNAGADEDFKLEVKEDDHTVVFTADVITFVFTHDGENVTGYTTYTEYDSAEDAKTVADTYKALKDQFVERGIKSVTAKGKYLITEYLESGFAYKTYEDLKVVADMFK
ncbi:MAG: hypothetical protein MJ175_12165 [Clostridia bacterium]|nr:hypothetical protein [Clostridia bacterium]